MSESQEIQQIEYRWQPGTDMTAVASSMSGDSRRSWEQRLGWWVRHPDVNAPTESVRYEVLGGGVSAAFAWRQRDPRAALVTDGPQTRPVVSRVLVGSAQVLTPEVAISLCATGLPELIGPRPGSVSAGANLPAITGDELARLVNAETDGLDAAAAEEKGLELVIAAALGSLDTPLSVELPEQFIARPVRGGPQAHLLWGLWTTLWPLLGPRFGRRTWSFSTFEPPLGDTDPEALGAIVFRATQAAGQTAPPLAFRSELLVRPHEPVLRTAETREQELALQLVAVYQAHGGKALHQLLTEWTKDCSTTERRVDAVYGMLAALPWGGLLGDGMPGGGGAAEGTGTGAPAAGGYSSGARTVLQPTLGAAGHPAVPVPVPAGQPQTERTGEFAQQLVKLSELVGYLSGGPEFESALRAMRAGRFDTNPDDRALSRKQLRDHGWYINTLERNRQQRVDDILVMIFMHTVLPDLSRPEMARELTGWAGQTSTPTRVIKALCAAGEGTVQQPELTQILAPALGGRWLAEHGISAPPVQVLPVREPSVQVPTAGGPGPAPHRDAPSAGGESRQQPLSKSSGPYGVGQSASAQQVPGFPGAVPRGAAPGSAVPPLFGPGPSDPMPLLSMETAITFLRRRIPVYAALLIAIGLMIVVLIA